MTAIIVDAAASQALATELSDFMSRSSASAVFNGLVNSASGAAELVVTDRLPLSASVLDQTTGLRTVLTDPADIRALFAGAHAYVAADASGPTATADVQFDWGADMAGKPIVYVGQIMDQPGHVLNFVGNYGIDNGYDVGRAVTDGLARSFADSVGGMRSDLLGVDHGVALAASIDWNGWLPQIGNPNASSLFYHQGPIGFQDGTGGTFDYGLSYAATTTFEGLSGGGYRTVATVNIGEDATARVTQTNLAVGAEVLGQRYETYTMNEMVLDGIRVITDPVNGGLVLSDQAFWAASDMGGMSFSSPSIVYAAQSVYQLDMGIQRYDGIANSQVAIDIGHDLALWGFAEGYSFDHARIVGIDFDREVNMTSHALAYGAQTIDGDVVYDAAGATGYGTSALAPVLAIDDRAATADTIIFGAGGATFEMTGYYDTTTSVDRIEAGHGDDMVIVGDGYDPNGVLVNVAHGNDGSDIVVGGISNDHLFGDAGNDMLVVSDGVDVLDGGDGYDVADAGQAFGYMSSQGIVYDAATGLITGERTSTTLVDIERVNGTAYDDVMLGGAEQVIDGNVGNDELHVGAGGIAIGGDGQDAYHVALAQSRYEKVMLLGFDQDDTLWFDGIRHLGSTDGSPSAWNTEAQDPNDFWTDTLFTDGQQDGLATIRLEHHVGGSVTATTDVIIAGFAQNDGGVSYDHAQSMTATYSDVIDMFKGAGYVPQDQMFGLVM
jgi:hypothetical protein